MEMRYFADKDGNYIGGKNDGTVPEGAAYSTNDAPAPGQKFDDAKGVWVSPAPAQDQAAQPQAKPDDVTAQIAALESRVAEIEKALAASPLPTEAKPA